MPTQSNAYIHTRIHAFIIALEKGCSTIMGNRNKVNQSINVLINELINQKTL